MTLKLLANDGGYSIPFRHEALPSTLSRYPVAGPLGRHSARLKGVPTSTRYGRRCRYPGLHGRCHGRGLPRWSAGGAAA